MKKVYQKCLWISYITIGIAVFFFSLAVIVGTIFLWFINKDLSFNWFMSLLSFIMLIFLCLEIREFIPSHWQDKRKEFREEIEMISDDWMEHTWLPLKRNSKRKEFWILQLWPLGKLCSYLARYILDLIIYSIVVFGIAYYLLSEPNQITPSNIFTILMTVIWVMNFSIFSYLLVQVVRQKLIMSKLFKSLFDLMILGSMLMTLTVQFEQSGRTVEGVKNFSLTINQFINGHMYLIEVGIILFLVGYVSTKLIKRSIEKEIEIDLIPTLFGYEYYIDFGRYDELINTGIVHTSIYEATVKGVRTTLKDGQESKAIDRRKEVYNFYEVEASLRYGIGKLSLDGKNIPQNKPYIGWKSDALEVSKKLSMEEDELQ
ncbi:TPA: hypothetical protein ACG877_002725 [Enterococcus faecium]|uniref:hypothetical protein n=1 Tax=Enterococcus faecium TaxID=1352 RepID=UPI001C03212D|nr:hypothetical protein [Enterococcus faecium]MDT6502871.1 hypothetical protein [Enterococcus faecium]MDT6518174.1 hypothetical protein [Enterococcus faecium]MDT6579525.1 hypothetical protein [Enterococcus faecium]MDT6894545.1 hypothetical protein [Enterococcus faecium]